MELNRITGNDFRVGPMADIQLEFRTTELNGVLLSVSEKRGSASLSLSIDDGSVTNQTHVPSPISNHSFIVFHCSTIHPSRWSLPWIWATTPASPCVRA